MAKQVEQSGKPNGGNGSERAGFDPGMAEAAREIVLEELQILREVRANLHEEVGPLHAPNYDDELLELRDSLGEAHGEEVPQIVHQMANLASLSSHVATRGGAGRINPDSPYFGHMRVRQDDRVRDVLLGSATHTLKGTPYPIIDWRHAPISRVFYLYEEGDEYEEELGGRWVEGEILAHRKLMFHRGQLTRIDCAQGVFSCEGGVWRQSENALLTMAGGEGAALRPGHLSAPDSPMLPAPTGQDGGDTVGGAPTLGVGAAGQADVDRRLSAITGLIDSAQFEVISRPESGVVIIDGGAGTGKTTIALHRIAYLAYADPERFATERMLGVVFSKALAAYIGQLLPGLGVEGVRIEVFEELMEGLRKRHFSELHGVYREDTPANVIRLKQHPATWGYLSNVTEMRAREFSEGLLLAVAGTETAAATRAAWDAMEGDPLGQRITRIAGWAAGKDALPGVGKIGKDWLGRKRLVAWLENNLPPGNIPVALAIEIWREAFLSLEQLKGWYHAHAPGVFSDTQLEEVRDWCFTQYSAAQDFVTWKEERKERKAEGIAEPLTAQGEEIEAPEPWWDREDDTLLLLLHTLVVGALRSRKRRPLRFRHLMVDEAQDLSPLDLRLLITLADTPHSVTLAGDTDQRMVIHGAFTRWEEVTEHLGLESTAISPLQVGYRSTRHIMEFARGVLGELASERAWIATREGVPVELLHFGDPGQAVAVLATQLRNLMRREPGATVALITRYPAQADMYYDGLRQTDMGHLRRVTEQGFSFRPGIEVTDITQVKGLEFDYVLMLDADRGSYPDDPEARYLMHIGATRAAHQLLLLSCKDPSPLIPPHTRVHLF